MGTQPVKFLPHVGNQVEFPVPPGILNYAGDNTVGLSIWNQDEASASVSVGMKVLGVYESSLDTDPGEPLRIVNPGSPTDKRRQPHGTVGLLVLADGGVESWTLVEVG